MSSIIDLCGSSDEGDVQPPQSKRQRVRPREGRGSLEFHTAAEDFDGDVEIVEEAAGAQQQQQQQEALGDDEEFAVVMERGEGEWQGSEEGLGWARGRWRQR